MLIDARTISEKTIIETDVCIVGAGAAGITLAREFIGHPFRVCLVESGGLEYDEDTQSLYEGENIGRSYEPLDEARMRYFGGTTNIWSGWCRPLDEIDFEERDWIPYSGWPFSKSHLDPFYKRAQVTCQLGPYSYEVEDWETDDRPRLPFVSSDVKTTIYQFSPPTRFGDVYRDEIVKADNVRTYLYANVIEIETPDNARVVTRLCLATLQGKKFWITAKHFILATGGIENARLLLVSNKIQKVGLGNQNDLVGRFFGEHPHLGSGIFLPSKPSYSPDLYLEYFIGKKSKNDSIVGGLTLSAETLRRESITNFCATMGISSWENVSKGFASFIRFTRAIRRREMPDDFIKHLGNVISDIDDVTVALYRRLFAKRKYSKEQRKYSEELFILHSKSESVPNPDSRVTLTEERDRLGMNRIALNWQLSEIDIRSIKKAQEIIGLELGRAGLGRLKSTFDNDAHLISGGYHHIGTTRMHADPQKGVVDKNCRVHGIANLYIASSSVFPTTGYANPTLTIVALSIRLADHLKGIMKL